MRACRSLEEYYPGDGSTLVPCERSERGGRGTELIWTRLFMNLVELKKGEGMYVGADGPHAWLTGGTSFLQHSKHQTSFAHAHARRDRRAHGGIR